MRKICLLLSCLLIIQLLMGCSAKDEEILQPVNFYYINKEISYNTSDGVIRSEVREGSGFQNTEDLLRIYLKGPESSDLQSLIPDDVSLQSCVIDDGIAHILLSSQFAELSGVKLTTVCSAFLLTVHDYAGIETICIKTENSKLDDKEEIMLSLDEIVLMDTVTSEEPKE